jgi:hypothetical protein
MIRMTSEWALKIGNNENAPTWGAIIIQNMARDTWELTNKVKNGKG